MITNVVFKKLTTEREPNKIFEIDINKIIPNPCQPRKIIREEELIGLSQSIRKYGLIQPVAVRRIDRDRFELISGERRLRACRMIGLEKIPATVIDVLRTDSAVLAIIENIQRKDLDFLEEGEAYASLLNEHGLTQEELAERVGKTQSNIANKVRLLRLSPHIRAMIREYNLSERHARALLRLPDDKERFKALKVIVDRNLNVIKTEEYIDRLMEPIQREKEKPKNRLKVLKDVRIFANTIKQAVDIMQKSGVDAETVKTENDDFIEYSIKISKKLKDIV
ncbi:MAG: ParB/RepB/Spo0J family partition protein [Clostridia bacterium]|nr:ParB/RepB/Spo0J family partition protein [Clostridia bacterium]